jgi:hypothetical protein
MENETVIPIFMKSNSFGQENTSYLNPYHYSKIPIKTAIKQLILDIYFNPSHPENHTVRFHGWVDSTCTQIFDDNNWDNYVDADLALDKMLNRCRTVLNSDWNSDIFESKELRYFLMKYQSLIDRQKYNDIIFEEFKKFKNNTSKRLCKIFGSQENTGLVNLYKDMEREIIAYKPGFSSTIGHETVELEYNGRMIDIDKNIASLVSAIWRHGINTRMCCEDNFPENYIWIEFSAISDIDKFMEILFVGEKFTNMNEIYRFYYTYRETNQSQSDLDKLSKDEYNNTSVIALKHEISVRFPQTDYEWVLKKFS